MTRKIRWFAMLVPALFVLAAWPTHAQEKDEDSLIVAEDLLIDDLLSEEAGAEPLEEAERLEEAVEVAPAAEPEPIEPAVEEKGWDVGPEEEPLLPQEEPLVFEEEPLLVEEGPAALEEPAEAEEELPLVEMPVPMEEELPVALPEAPEERMEPEAVPEEIVPEAEVEMAEETIPEAAAEEAEIEDLDTIVEDAFREAAAEGIPEMPAVEALPVLPAPEEEVAETLPGPAPEAAAVPQEIAEMLDREELRRMAEEQHGRESLENANKAYRAGQYARAISLYEQALTYIPDRPDSREVRKEAVRGMAKSYYSQALDLRSRGQLEEAEQMAQAAVAQGHGRAARLVEVIREERTAPPAPPPVEEEGKRWEQKDFREQQEEIADLMSRGRQAMLVGEYDQAQHYFESALKRDPYHAEAMRYMQDILSRKYDQASAELEATRRDMMTGVRKTWNPRDYGVAEETDAAGPPPPPPPPPPGTERRQVPARGQCRVRPVR